MDKPTILILGCERSGSTWLSNILDSSPTTVSYMEPFADYAGLFPGFPQRFNYLNEVNVSQKVWVEEKLDALYGIKFGFFYKPGNSLAVKKLDTAYINLIKRFNLVAGLGASKKIEQYELLNLTKLDFRKHNRTGIDQTIIKELRLNFKISLVKSLFSSSKVVVAIRNPVLQIDSILNHFKKNRLNELRRSLLFFESQLVSNSRFEIYKDRLKGFGNKVLVEQLALYWLINYNTLIEDLDSFKLPYMIANNDILSLNPEEEVKKILGFCEIEARNQTLTYLNRSTTVFTDVKNSTDTNRRSSEYYLKKVEQLGEELTDRIHAVLNTGPLSTKLRSTLEFRK